MVNDGKHSLEVSFKDLSDVHDALLAMWCVGTCLQSVCSGPAAWDEAPWKVSQWSNSVLTYAVFILNDEKIPNTITPPEMCHPVGLLQINAAFKETHFFAARGGQYSRCHV